MINWRKLQEAEDELLIWAVERIGAGILEQSIGNVPEWDAKVEDNQGNEVLVELKIDYMSEKTGNVAIEHWNCKSNKPSGISATGADMWCHAYVHEGRWQCAFIEVPVLREWMQHHAPLKRVIAGGDNNSNMFIYTISDFQKVGTHKFWKEVD